MVGKTAAAQLIRESHNTIDYNYYEPGQASKVVYRY